MAKLLDTTAKQSGMDLTVDLFAHVGLQMNAQKTEAMIGHAANPGQCLTTPAHKQWMPGTGELHQEAKKRKVSCPTCDKELQSFSLACHMLSLHGNPFRPAKQCKPLEDANNKPCLHHWCMPHHQELTGCPVLGCPGGLPVTRHSASTLLSDTQGI